MSWSTEPKNTKAKKTYHCNWCYTAIRSGEIHKTYTSFFDGCMTVRLHAECLKAQDNYADESGDSEVELPTSGTYRRGCWCGEKIEFCKCRIYTDNKLLERAEA